MKYEIELPPRIRVPAKRIFARDTGLSMREVVEYFCQYSDDIPEYPWSPALSYRAEYFDQCLTYLPPERQHEALLGLCSYEGPMQYGAPPPQDVQRLRESLMAMEAPVHEAAQLLEQVDWPFVQSQWRKAVARVESDPEGSITAARTLVETVCKHVLNELGVEYVDDGDLPRLYKTTAQALALSPEQHAEQFLKQLLGGCAGIVAGSAAMRNAYGDSHGKGMDYSRPSGRYARLAVNAAATLSTFLIESYQAKSEGA